MLIIAEKANQLCNRLFVFAHIMAFAIEHNLTLLNPAFDEYADYFITTSSDLLCRYPPRQSSLPRIKKIRRVIGDYIFILSEFLCRQKVRNYVRQHVRVVHSGYITTLADPTGEFRLDDQEFLNTPFEKQVIFFRGPLFRDPLNFQKHKNKIREYFTPIETFQYNVNTLMGQIRKTSRIVVGVHIRRGDYENFIDGRYFYSIDQYVCLMNKIRNCLSPTKVSFLLCSNELLDGNRFQDFNFFLGTGHPVEDLYGLAKCDYIVGPPSTYSAWASFFGGVPLYTIEDITLAPTLSAYKVVAW